MPTQQTLLAFALVSAGIMLVPGPSNFSASPPWAAITGSRSDH